MGVKVLCMKTAIIILLHLKLVHKILSPVRELNSIFGKFKAEAAVLVNSYLGHKITKPFTANLPCNAIINF